MKIFMKKILDVVKFWRWGWLRRFVKCVFNEVVIPATKELTREGMLFILESIKDQALDQKTDGYTKIKRINSAFRKKFSSETIASDALNAVIASSYSALKKRGELYQ